MLLFPLTWVTVALIAWMFSGWWAVAISLVTLPLCGYAAGPIC